MCGSATETAPEPSKPEVNVDAKNIAGEEEDFSFSLYEVAYRYGVDVSEVTPEFFAEKRRIAEEEFEKEMDQFEKENGFRPGKMTPERQKELDDKLQELRENYRLTSQPK
jgi:hypothetical protein